ncbi:uncharacterized protein LOC135390058 isoform X3 [Ornithodoros turicata]|uniref:uncharacterized protein LOC135390058 isoform X3 n=1 Tax=Ornithodoros turicata TaxID=34597 RepID=UPI0031396D37
MCVASPVCFLYEICFRCTHYSAKCIVLLESTSRRRDHLSDTRACQDHLKDSPRYYHHYNDNYHDNYHDNHHDNYHDNYTTFSETKTVITDENDALRSLWLKKIRSFGVLDTEITPTTDKKEISDVVDVMKMIQIRLKRYDTDGDCFTFIGVAPLYKSNRNADLTQRFYELIQGTNPDVVLFRTTYLKVTKGRTYAGPSVWEDINAVDQPNFVDSLKLRNSVTLPPHTRELLSLSVASIGVIYQRKIDIVDDLDGAKAADLKQRIPTREVGCTPEYKQGFISYDDKRLQHCLFIDGADFVWYFESGNTVSRKMCQASVTFHYTGGWAAYEIDTMLQKNKECGWDKQYDGMRPLLIIQEKMVTQWKDCNALGR